MQKTLLKKLDEAEIGDDVIGFIDEMGVEANANKRDSGVLESLLRELPRTSKPGSQDSTA